MRRKVLILTTLLMIGFGFDSARAQVVVSFSYQGKLDNAGSPANGEYDFQFKLYEVFTGGTQIGSDWVRENVQVTNGIFTTYVSFGTQPFTSRTGFFIEVAVRPGASTGPFTSLSPRTAIQTSPYALESFNASSADSLGGYPAGSFVLGDDMRLTDARNPLPNSPNYIQNGTVQQTSSNFSISGNGTVGGILRGNVVEALTQFDIAGNRILSNPGSGNIFAGAGAGLANTSGSQNAFFGWSAGYANTQGVGNSFLGAYAGAETTAGGNNSFFGSSAGRYNHFGNFNSFVGHRAGETSDGNLNSFFGTGAGQFNTTGSSNTFVGHDAGNANGSGSFNTVLGDSADISPSDLLNATAIGSKSLVSQSNSLVLGSINGVNSATADTNVGIGTTAPQTKLHVSGVGAVRVRVNSSGNTGVSLTLNEQPGWSVATVTPGQFQIFNDALAQNAVWIDPSNNNVGIGTVSSTAKLDVGGTLRIATLGSAGGVSLCWNAFQVVSACSSSTRYKTNIVSFNAGLELIRRLRPVSFDWRDGGMHDLGLVAEEVANVEPLLTTTNGKGQVEGVKYDRIGVLLINAVNEQQDAIKEQQAEIESQRKTIETQQKQIEVQQRQIDALVKVVCSANPSASICERKE